MPDRIEREIEDILNKLDDFVPEGGKKPIPFKRAANRKQQSRGWLSQRLARVSLNQIMVYALIALILGFILRSLPFASWVMIGAIVVLVTAFVLSLRNGSGSTNVSGNYQKRWRGEPIELPNPYRGPTIGDRIVAWFRRRK
jgi:hypothetical protein